MRTPLIILLTLFSLLSQWLWLEHNYHEHDSGEVCEICLIGQAQSHAAIPPALHLPAALPEQFSQPLQPLQIVEQPHGRQNIRAPPAPSNPTC
jgi:hypothetical protein